MTKDLISILDVRDDIHNIIEEAIDIKAKRYNYQPLINKGLGMIFEKPSTRTRVSFEVGINQLGGYGLYLSPKDLQIGRGETIPDTARVLSRFVDGIMYRAFEHKVMMELAKHATIPVINGLDDLEHPCQILADLQTIKEHFGDFSGLKIAYVGDGNNVCNSLLLGAALTGMDMSVGCPEGYEPDKDILAKAKELTNKTIEVLNSPQEAVQDADVIYTDVWVSMGEEADKERKGRAFLPFQVNMSLLNSAKNDTIVLHCLPAHRGMEITDAVIDGPRSMVWDQAENRLHAQKAVMVRLMGD